MPRLRQLRVKEGVLKEVFQVFSILEIDFFVDGGYWENSVVLTIEFVT